MMAPVFVSLILLWVVLFALLVFLIKSWILKNRDKTRATDKRADLKIQLSKTRASLGKSARSRKNLREKVKKANTEDLIAKVKTWLADEG